MKIMLQQLKSKQDNLCRGYCPVGYCPVGRDIVLEPLEELLTEGVSLHLSSAEVVHFFVRFYSWATLQTASVLPLVQFSFVVCLPADIQEIGTLAFCVSGLELDWLHNYPTVPMPMVPIVRTADGEADCDCHRLSAEMPCLQKGLEGGPIYKG